MSETKIVNVKVSNIRPKYKNLKEWSEDNDNVYIARKQIVFVDSIRYPPDDSIWANPYKIDTSTTREDVINKYKTYITDKINKNPFMKEELNKLKGKNLGCWCYPEKCHGDVLIELINKI